MLLVAVTSDTGPRERGSAPVFVGSPRAPASVSDTKSTVTLLFNLSASIFLFPAAAVVPFPHTYCVNPAISYTSPCASDLHGPPPHPKNWLSIDTVATAKKLRIKHHTMISSNNISHLHGCLWSVWETIIFLTDHDLLSLNSLALAARDRNNFAAS